MKANVSLNYMFILVNKIDVKSKFCMISKVEAQLRVDLLDK